MTAFRTIGWIVMGCAVALTAALLLASHGRAELEASRAAWQAGDAHAAITHARRAARAYVPRGAHVGMAQTHLRDMAHALEKRGDLTNALFAWRASSGAANASRSSLRPQELDGRQAGSAITRIAELNRTQRPPRSAAGSPMVRGDPAVSLPDEPSPPYFGWSLVLLAGGTAWLIGSFRLVQLWNARTPWRSASVRVAGAMAVLGAVGWATGLVMT